MPTNKKDPKQLFQDGLNGYFSQNPEGYFSDALVTLRPNFQAPGESDADFESRARAAYENYLDSTENQAKLKRQSAQSYLEGLPESKNARRAVAMTAAALPFLGGLGAMGKAGTALSGLASAWGMKQGYEDAPPMSSIQNLLGLTGAGTALAGRSAGKIGQFINRHPALTAMGETGLAIGANRAINRQVPDPINDTISVLGSGIIPGLAGRFGNKLRNAPSFEHTKVKERLPQPAGPELPDDVQPFDDFALYMAGQPQQREAFERLANISKTGLIFDEDMNALLGTGSRGTHRIPLITKRIDENVRLMKGLGFKEKDIQSRFMEYAIRQFYKEGAEADTKRLVKLMRQPSFRKSLSGFMGEEGLTNFEKFTSTMTGIQEALKQDKSNNFRARVFSGGSGLGNVLGISLGGLEAIIDPSQLAERIASGRANPSPQMQKVVDWALKELTTNPAKATKPNRDVYRVLITTLFPGAKFVDRSNEDDTAADIRQGLLGQ